MANSSVKVRATGTKTDRASASKESSSYNYYLGKVATPTISASWGHIDGVQYKITVTNNDIKTATIYAGRSRNAMSSYGNLAGGATRTII